MQWQNAVGPNTHQLTASEVFAPMSHGMKRERSILAATSYVASAWLVSDALL